MFVKIFVCWFVDIVGLKVVVCEIYCCRKKISNNILLL